MYDYAKGNCDEILTSMIALYKRSYHNINSINIVIQTRI